MAAQDRRPGRGSVASAPVICALAAGLSVLSACKTPPPAPVDQVAKGREIFFNETFGGNGRTCGTCHPAENNFTLDAAFIATLPPDNPLFVAETNAELRKNFENPKLMRQFGLILENLDGFEDLENKFVMRGVPHVLAMRTSVNSKQGPRTGWSGDGAPGDGTLRSFATGAVIQHFTKTLNRVAGVDFRLPTAEELDALEAFTLSLGRQQDLALPLPLKGAVAKRGQEIFLDNRLGKCNLCHANAGATANFGGGNLGNANFNTGVANLPDQPAKLSGEKIPLDDGFGRPGNNTFNTPPLVEAASTGPFFHNNSIETIEGAVAFYNGDSFNKSPAGRGEHSAKHRAPGGRRPRGLRGARGGQTVAPASRDQDRRQHSGAAGSGATPRGGGPSAGGQGAGKPGGSQLLRAAEPDQAGHRTTTQRACTTRRWLLSGREQPC